MNFIYIIQCRGNRLYTGYTTDMKRRYQEHLEGCYKSKFTRAFKPEKLMAVWQIANDRSYAQKIESYIKSLTKKQKNLLIKNAESLENKFTLVDLDFYVHDM